MIWLISDTQMKKNSLKVCKSFYLKFLENSINCDLAIQTTPSPLTRSWFQRSPHLILSPVVIYFVILQIFWSIEKVVLPIYTYLLFFLK